MVGAVERPWQVLLTDRTFLAKAPLLCRAHALVHGRQRCSLQDLHAVRHMTAFRVPASVHARIDELIAEVRGLSRTPAAERSRSEWPRVSCGSLRVVPCAELLCVGDRAH
jgi:hypothetical protein